MWEPLFHVSGILQHSDRICMKETQQFCLTAVLFYQLVLPLHDGRVKETRYAYVVLCCKQDWSGQGTI